MKQNRIIEKGKLLNSEGDLAQRGYATNYVLEYDRNDIKAPKWRIKEWDYYYIGNDSYGVALTISDVGILGVVTLSIIDLEKATETSSNGAVLFPMGKFNMPSSPEIGSVSRKAGKVEMSFKNDGKVRRITGFFPKVGKQKEDVKIDITLDQAPEEYMFIATPFNKPKHFYYNAKVNCLRANGGFTWGEKFYPFEKAPAVLDWGRGVWTYDNTWYWGSMQTWLPDGKPFGFNIGYGFGDTSAATENMLFHDGKIHKLDHVKFNIPGEDEGKDDYMKPWTFTSSDGRLEMDFEPVFDRNSVIRVGPLAMMPHQVFGKFSGTAILDDGTKIEFKDAMGFAEKVHNKW